MFYKSIEEVPSCFEQLYTHHTYFENIKLNDGKMLEESRLRHRQRRRPLPREGQTRSEPEDVDAMGRRVRLAPHDTGSGRPLEAKKPVKEGFMK